MSGSSPLSPTYRERRGDATFDIHVGDARAVLRRLRGGIVQTIVTSPPYFRLRDYGRTGQIGREETLAEYIGALVEVFRECRRTLRDDGTLWVNIGDTFCSDRAPSGAKRKDLLGVPWMLAFALRADGWYLRSEVIWEKPNASPESAADRPSRSHEQLFLFSKRPVYYYDRFAVLEPHRGKPPSGRKAALLRARGEGAVNVRVHSGKWAEREEARGGYVSWNPRGRNRRTVWQAATIGFKSETVGVDDVDHFAMFPPALIRPCIRASTPEGGSCGRCGAPTRRKVASFEDLEDVWVPSCSCPPAPIVPAAVLDPFAGSCTTVVVAAQEGRSGIAADISADYARLGVARVRHALQALADRDYIERVKRGERQP